MKKKKLLPVLVAATLSLSCFTAVPIVSQAEGVTEAPVERVIMYRLYNPNSGEHFYTGNEGEKNNLVMLGWRDEGIGWIAPATSNTPVYRLYNENAGDHHYTMEADEKDNLLSVGWKFEGIGWYSDDNETVPLYREYNSNAVSGTHNYTTDKAEHDSLVAAGWKDENIGWYAIGEGLGAGATQYAFNDFLSNFSEQNAFSKGFDVNNWNAEDIVDFAYLYLKLHSWDAISLERINESSYYTIPLTAVNDTLHRFFGITITDTEASSEFSQVPLNRPYGSNTYYMNGRFYFPAADGEAYTRLTIVKKAESLGDGNLRLHFDIYSLDTQEYLNNNGAKDDYYYLTSEQAAQNRYLTKETSGTAVVRPYEYNGEHTYQLVSYYIGNDLFTEPVDQHPDWSKLYYRFIINKQYMSISQPIYNSEYYPIVFSLHDLDADGTPELIMYNGCPGMAGAADYVFTCTDGKIKYVGNVGFRQCDLYFYNDKNYPGLFCTDGNGGWFQTDYFSLKNGAIIREGVLEKEYLADDEMEEPKITKITNDDVLYNLATSGKAIHLEQFTEADIRTMGWDTFLSMYGFANVKYDNSSTYVNFKWNPNILFSEEPTDYNKDLAIAGLTLSAAVYHGFDSIDSTFKSLGYSVDPHWNLYYDQIEVNWPGHSIYSRPIIVNGEPKMLITLAIAGTRNIFSKDGLTDVIGGVTSFGIAADNVKSSLDAYVKKYYNDLSSNDIIFFITGHSLGGATSGRVAKKMLDDGTPKNNVFCYPIAPPHNTDNIRGEECENIHNIINQSDQVTHIGFFQTVGELHVLNYEKYKEETGDTYNELFGTTIPDNWLGMHELKTYLALLCAVPEGKIEYMIEPRDQGGRVVKIL